MQLSAQIALEKCTKMPYTEGVTQKRALHSVILCCWQIHSITKVHFMSTPQIEGRCILLNFWQIFTNLCEEHGKSATTALEDLGLSKGNAARWKSGGGPTLSTAVRIAQYFGCSLDDLVDHHHLTT